MKSSYSLRPVSQKVVMSVAKCCVKELGVSWREVVGTGRSHQGVLWARQVAQYITHRITGATLSQIGAAFDRDHTGIISNLKRVQGFIDVYPEISTEIEELKSRCMQLPGVPKHVRIIKKAA